MKYGIYYILLWEGTDYLLGTSIFLQGKIQYLCVINKAGKVRATVLLTRTVTNQCVVRHASASCTAMWLDTNAP